MSDTMPERVWLTPDPYAMSGDWWADGKTVREDGEVPYVPEQRALDAERERDGWKQGQEHYRRMWLETVDELRRVAAERDALQADLKALLPLARAGLNAYDYALAKEQYGSAIVPVLDRVSIDESLAAVRAILDREGI